MKAVLLDTGVIVALLDRSETHHARCVTAIEGLERPLVTCEAVIAESCYLLRGLPGAAETVLQNVERQVFQIPFQLPPLGGAGAKHPPQVPRPFRRLCRRVPDSPGGRPEYGRHSYPG